MIRVDYIDHMGSDLSVVNAAKVSNDKFSTFDDNGNLKPEDVRLVKFLARGMKKADWDKILVRLLEAKNVQSVEEIIQECLNVATHFTPFTHVSITLRETVPIIVARQRFKSTIGFSYNEISRRYVDSKPEFYKPDIWRKRAKDKKQGSLSESVEKIFHRSNGTTSTVERAYAEFLNYSEQFYDDLLKHGAAPEQARMVLPQSMMTSYFVTGSLAAWARIYNLRKKDDAQKEIRDLVNLYDDIISPLFPVSWEALTS